MLDNTRIAEHGTELAVCAQAESVGKNGASKVGRDGEEILHDLASRGPVLEHPLCIQSTLGPGDDGDFLVLGNRADILDGVGDVFRIDLSITEHGTRNVHPDWIGEGLSGEQLAKVVGEVGTTICTRAGYEQDWSLAAISVAWWEVDCCAQLCLGNGIWCIGG